VPGDEVAVGVVPDRPAQLKGTTMSKRRQWEWRPRGWFIMLTIGGSSWGLGFMVCGANGTDIYFGPVILTVQQPMPKCLRDEFQSEAPTN